MTHEEGAAKSEDAKVLVCGWGLSGFRFPVIAIIVALAYTLKIDEAFCRVAARRRYGGYRKRAEQRTWPGTKAAFEFLSQTACSPGEVRLSGLRGIDLASGFWTMAVDRSEIPREDSVLLAPRPVAVLDGERKLSHGEGLIFPSASGKALSGSTLAMLLRGQGIPAVPEGFRLSFRDWCGETGLPRRVGACRQTLGSTGSLYRPLLCCSVEGAVR